MERSRPGTVADTMIFLQASISDSNVASSFFRRVETGEVTLFVSDELLAEVREVLSRPEVRRRNARLSNEALDQFLKEVEKIAIRINPLPSHFEYSRDPGDEHVLNLAIEAKARYLVTYDRDLLDLMDDALPEGKMFLRRYAGLTILEPGELIRILNAGQL